MSSTNPQNNAQWPWSLLSWPTPWAGLFNLAPQNLQESILPWTFAGLVINENNSSNPGLERTIVSKESYGKQLGRISDALESLIRQTPVKPDSAINGFLQIKAHIDALKHNTEATRFKAVLADLRCLRDQNRPLFDECLKQVAALDHD